MSSTDNSQSQFDLVVQDLRPWASRVERQAIHRVRYLWLVMLLVVLVTVVTAVGAWYLWVSLRPPLVR